MQLNDNYGVVIAQLKLASHNIQNTVQMATSASTWQIY